MIIERDGKRYAIEIKEYKKNSKLIGYKNEPLDKFICNSSYYKGTDLILVLVCDALRVSDKAKRRFVNVKMKVHKSSNMKM